jgi:hypothetical protein
VSVSLSRIVWLQKVSNFTTQVDQKASHKMDADRPAEDRGLDQKVSNFNTQVDQKALHKMDADGPAEERDTDQQVSNFNTQVDQKACTQNAFLPVRSVTYVFRTDVHEFSHTLLELFHKYSF